MTTIYKDGDYATLRTNKGVYLIGYGSILAFRPNFRTNSSDNCSMYIDKVAYENRCFNLISRFCGRDDIIERVEKGEFKVKPLFDLI